ncbi:MAG TPA: phage terminase large subunit [Bryobacteraceae bacterium]|nr:phage terminase large subunit [Bryobacteraceae bacterium]
MSVLTARRSERLDLSPFQQRVCAIPEQFNVFLGGGRGGAKSHAMAFLALRHAAQYGDAARILYIRQTYKGLADFTEITRELFGRIFGKAARFNQTEGVWRLPGGGYFELGQLEGIGDYPKYQGRSFTLLMVDEAGQYATPNLIDKLRSNMRGPAGMPIRQIIAANPGDVGHAWLAGRYVFKSRPRMPFDEPMTGSQFVYAPSTYRDNPFIDAENYRKSLEASCPTDPELLRAWLEGDWAINRGAFFGMVLSEQRNAIPPWMLPLKMMKQRTYAGNGVWLQGTPDPWRFFITFDFGVSAPSYCGIMAESPGSTGPDGQYYSRGSVLLLDEVVTAAPGQLNVGLGWTVPRIAEAIREKCRDWGIRPRGVADDAIWARSGSGVSASIAEEFRKEGVTFRPAKKADRVSGWEVLSE